MSVEQLHKVPDFFDPIHPHQHQAAYLGMMTVNGTARRIKSTDSLAFPAGNEVLHHHFFIMVYRWSSSRLLRLVDLITMIGAYRGLEMISNEIENPFGYDSNDLPITQIQTNQGERTETARVELPLERKRLRVHFLQRSTLF
jgi:putative membrane protein